ncbi:hypothetical protein HCN44_008685 [Aphidius gifuensis]|uniref:Fcf2 pre-rRNA processing C-terminal domain-containing protein n=1 Tax=Aphidius gifuensis TaxID=684658 RepID=A0A834XNL9_APHGI|nr:deoxynucleotidyltransferase terminal-interacting protein 2 [Aphidius gifuensis]KAF7990011.1 hypothetical protein HCN44_008685 [Aphidius gifuensis]
MDSFVIDTKGSTSLLSQNQAVDDDDDDFDFEAMELNPNKIRIPRPRKVVPKEKVVSGKDFDLEQFEIDMGWKSKRGNSKKKVEERAMNVFNIIDEVKPVDEVLEKSAIKPGFETLLRVPRYDVSKRQQVAKNRHDREKTAGKKWFNLPKTEMTDDVKHDLEIIKMRSVLDPKHFYKKNDRSGFPKYFQVGKVVDSPVEYYNGRLTKKQRKNTIVEELMANAEFSKYNKRKYNEIVSEKQKTHHKAHKRAKKLKAKRR